MDDRSLSAVALRARGTGREVAMLARLTRDLPGWLRAPLSLHEASAHVRRRLATREQRFPGVVERLIYGHPTSPYLKLLRHAGCEPGDLHSLLRREGIEGTLSVLAKRGVYVTYDELKGRRVAVRGSASFQFAERDFDSPLIRPHYVVYTGGTRGRPGLVMRSLAHNEEVATNVGANLLAHDLVNVSHAFWVTNPVTLMTIFAKLGQPTLGWFYQSRLFPPKAWVGARHVSVLGRLAGHRFPIPRFVDLQWADRLAAWLARRAGDRAPILIGMQTSSAVRVATAARQAGFDLRGVVFHIQSEPLTPARHRQIVASGASVIEMYSTIEISCISYSCAAPDSVDDMHLFGDRLGISSIGRGKSNAVGQEEASAS